MTIDDLSARLEIVERQNRRMRAGGTLALVLVAGLAALGQAAPPESAKVIRAERFELVDSGGVVRADLGAPREGFVSLRLMGGKGLVHASLTASADGGSSLMLSDRDQTGRVSLQVPPSGESAALVLMDREGKARAQLTTMKAGGASLLFMDAASKLRANLGTTPDGSPDFALRDENEKVIFPARR